MYTNEINLIPRQYDMWYENKKMWYGIALEITIHHSSTDVMVSNHTIRNFALAMAYPYSTYTTTFQNTSHLILPKLLFHTKYKDIKLNSSINDQRIT